MSPLELLRQPVLTAAPGLLGWTLMCTSGGVTTGGIIVETEAYRGRDDPAAHSFRGKTPRTAPMWEEGGTIYVYFSYGLHTILNLTTGPAGEAEAALIRALEPTIGQDTMAARRGLNDPIRLTNGPAKLAQALGISLSLSGTNLSDGVLAITPPPSSLSPDAIVQTTRIGISQGKDLPWRYYLKGNPWVSKL